MTQNNTKSLSSTSRRQRNNETQLHLYPPKLDDWSFQINNQLSIKRRTCTTFVYKEGPRGRDEARCGCNRLRREHSWEVIDSDETKWDPTRHTKAAFNNAYGFLPNTRVPYIRCDLQTEPTILAQLMLDVWKMKAPRLIMCIIGGAKYFKLNERLEREFIKGIIQAALKADGWIVTTGFKTGVVQLVGEAIHDHKVINPKSTITAIACSKWGAARNRQALILRKAAPPIDLNASMNVVKAQKGTQDLEPNHTHFLLLDDGTHVGYEVGDYRTRFVTAVSAYKNTNAPVVTVVVEGGPDTLSAIQNDLRHNIPVVLIDGSGRVPNLLAKFLSRTEALISRINKDADVASWKQVIDIQSTQDIDKLRAKFDPYADEIRDGLKEISRGSKTSEKDMNSLFNQFLYCLQPAIRSKIRVFSLESDCQLDDTIFEAIIEAKQSSTMTGTDSLDRAQLLELALAWDAIAVAKEHIIKDDLSDLKEKKKEEIFFRALNLDRPHFVTTFIKLNFDLPRMFYQKKVNRSWELRVTQLTGLYNYNQAKQSDRLFLFRKCLRKGQVENVADLDRVLNELVGDFMKPIYTHTGEGVLGCMRKCCPCTKATRVSSSRASLASSDDEIESELLEPEEAEKEIRELVYRDLFLWAILTNRIEMSKVILSHMRTRICAALIASKIFKSYLNYAYDNESKDLLREQADQFESYANESLKCCYNYDEEKACEIAIRRIEVFGAVSCLQVAVDADDKNFVGQPCCDQLLNNIWYGKMLPFRSSSSKRAQLILSIFSLGLLAPFLVNFRPENQISESPEEERRKNYEMTVNGPDDQPRKVEPRIQRRLNEYGIAYADNYSWKVDGCSRGFLRYFHQLKQFHESPIVKFSYDALSYLFFLLLFSYFLLFQFNAPTSSIPSIDWTEILVIIIVSTMLIEDIRQFLAQDSRTMFGKFSNYFVKNVFSSSIRITSYVLFYIGLILRFANASTDLDFSAARIVLAYDLEIWFIRSLAFLSIAQKMGPKLVMIRRMIIDLFFFIYIIIVAMTAYGVASRAMYDYNSDEDTDDLTFSGRSIFRHIIYPSYYLMYGSTDNELNQLNRSPDSGGAVATQVLLAFHMLFVNILLINLLIAMFSYTFDSVQAQTDLVWRYERYSLIREYFDRPPLFPPIIIITHCITLIKWAVRRCPHRGHHTFRLIRSKTFQMIANSREVDKDWSEFESYATNLYARSILTGKPVSASALAPSTNNQELTGDAMLANQGSSTVDMKAITDEMTSIRKVIGDLRVHAEEMNRCMQWMMNAMDRVKMSKEPKPRLASAAIKDSRTTDE